MRIDPPYRDHMEQWLREHHDEQLRERYAEVAFEFFLEKYFDKNFERFAYEAEMEIQLKNTADVPINVDIGGIAAVGLSIPKNRLNINLISKMLK